MVIQPDQEADSEEEKVASRRSLVKANSNTGGADAGGSSGGGGGDELLDMAFNGDEDDLLTDSVASSVASSVADSSSSSSSSSSSPNHSYVSESCAMMSASGAGGKHMSMSLTNLPFSTQTSGAPINASEPNLISKELFEQNINVSVAGGYF